VAGLAAAFGSGAMTNPIADIEEAQVLLVTGSNTTENHPVLSSYVKRAVKHKGAKLIVVDPRRIPLTRHAALWLRPRPGTDVAWINGLLHVIIKENLHDEKYVQERTVGFDEVRKIVEKYTPEYVEQITGIPAADLVTAARLYASVKAASILYTMGITQHASGTNNVKSLANLTMLCGNIGIRGGGLNPLRGQNNVQGACDMGALPNVFTGYQQVAKPEVRARMEEAWGVTGLPDKVGLAATEMIPAAHQGTLKALYIVGENPLVSDPDLSHTDESLRHLEFLVVQDIFMTETAKLAHVVLPAACFAETDGTFTNTERKVQRVRRAVRPPGSARADWEIVCDLAGRMGYPMAYAGTDAILDEVARVTPSYCGISHERLEDEGIHWPCTGSDHPGTPCLHIDQFTCGLGVFAAVEYAPPAEMPDAEYPLTLTTGRVLYQYHTGTMTMKTGGLNELAPECFVEIARKDARVLGIVEGEMVRVSSRRGEITARAVVSAMTAPGTVFLPFHFAAAAANQLTTAAGLDPVAKIPSFKVCAVRVNGTGEGLETATMTAAGEERS
jgi:formate dehydrogenase alpha subunit